MTIGRRLPVLLVALVAAVLAVAARIAACSDAGDGTAAPQVTPDGTQRIEIVFAGGAVAAGPQRYAVPLGSSVELVVASDMADEVHLHGYDRSSFVTAGATTAIRFTADLPGVFEVELEQRGTRLAELRVS